MHGRLAAQSDERSVADGVVVVVEQLELAAAVRLAQLALAPVNVVRTVHGTAAPGKATAPEEGLEPGMADGPQVRPRGADLMVARRLEVRREREEDVVLDEEEKDEVEDDGHEYDEERNGSLVRGGVAEKETAGEDKTEEGQRHAGA